MGFNQKEYNKGRTRGLELAYEMYADEGLEALRDDISFRLETQINTGSRTKRVDEYSEYMKKLVFETSEVMALNVLRDEFDFGKQRCDRFVSEWRKEKERLQDIPMIDWWKEEKDIRAKTKLDLICDSFQFKKPKYRKTSYEDGRDAAFEMVLRLAEQGKEEEIKDMLKFRDRSKANTNMYNKQCEDAVERTKDFCYSFVVLKVCQVIKEIFKFGEERLNRFTKRWDFKSDCMAEGYCDWQDMVGVLKNELKMNPVFPMMVNEGWLSGSEEKEVS